jgi:predicted nucleotidyltransferase
MRPLSSVRRCHSARVDGDVEAALHELSRRLEAVDGITALWVGGSLATGDHVPGVSDLDLVAVTERPLTGDRLARVTAIHRELDDGVASGMDLGCQYADADRLLLVAVEHPTWTHGDLVERSVSLVTRAELVLHGFAVRGPPPQDLLPPVTPAEVREAARAELEGYWSFAARRPGMFLRMPVMVDLGLTSMARGRHALATGELLTKSAAIEQVHAPRWLKDQLRARRRGDSVTSPRWRAAHVAWSDVWRTTWSVRSAPPGA